MIDLAHTATDRELAQMEKHLAEIYERANNEIGETWKAYLAEVEKEIKSLQDAYDAAKLSGDKTTIRKAGRELSAKKREKTLMDTHYRNLTKQLAGELSRVNETAVAYINGRLPNVYALNYNATANGVKTAVSGYSFELVDASTVRNLATSDKTLLPYKYVDGKKDVRWNTQKVNSEVLQGILQGESIPEIANRLSKVVSMNEASAIRNARTTVTSAENKGRMDMLHDAADKGVITHKVWMATHDSRVREAHADLDGQEQEIDEPFESELGDIMYPGDPGADPANVYNCRCTLTYKVVGFKKATENEGQTDNDFSSNMDTSIEGLSKPVRPKRRDYANEDEYYVARDAYRTERENYNERIQQIAENTVASGGIRSTDELMSWANSQGITISEEAISTIDIQSFSAARKTLDEMFDRFPEIKSFSVELEDGSILKTNFRIGTTSDGLLSANGGLNFNAAFFGQDSAISGITDGLDGMISGYLVRGDGSFSTLIRHEYGHNVQEYIEQKIADKYHYHVDDWRKHYETFAEYDKARTAYFAERHQYEAELMKLAGLSGSSEYSNTNTLELFAEGFAEWSSGGESEFGKAFGEFLRRWY